MDCLELEDFVDLFQAELNNLDVNMPLGSHWTHGHLSHRQKHAGGPLGGTLAV